MKIILKKKSAASDLGLHCLPVTHLWVSSLQWVRVDHFSKGVLCIGTSRKSEMLSRL